MVDCLLAYLWSKVRVHGVCCTCIRNCDTIVSSAEVLGYGNTRLNTFDKRYPAMSSNRTKIRNTKQGGYCFTNVNWMENSHLPSCLFHKIVLFEDITEYTRCMEVRVTVISFASGIRRWGSDAMDLSPCERSKRLALFEKKKKMIYRPALDTRLREYLPHAGELVWMETL